ncbi:uncharacterized protein LOC6538327 [Drosophila yakuba]|uniref:Chitin-binding type-2 domain-containing protein n=1 Tax=Drosophila yakuba TaxID=7245 RepID=B4PSA4_DROYA|nr:uncharacterized protein LOC6538327 [Drosophila yakuba]EDW98566.2 uncharacterized protein Dyak_GE23707 [Drosophila yakuba]
MELQVGRKYYKEFCVLAWICLMRPSFGSIIKDSVKCTEGSVAADTDDCASYFQCIDDETVHINCANGSYFEASNEICVVDEFGVCPTSRRLCFDGEIFEDLNDCLSYVKCIRGDLVKQRCPTGSYFNVISKNCRLSRTGNCASQREICLEGELKVDSEDCAGYLECLNGVLVKLKCPVGSYFEPIFKLCQVDENGVCSSSSNECTDGEVQVDPTNCAGYFNCENGKLETKTCPSGTYFEPTYKTCTVDLNGVCVDPPAKCTEGRLEIDPNNCAGYLKCINGEFVEENCPSGSYYDFRLETCSVDTEGVCVTIRQLCVEGLREKDPKDCAAYTQCIRGEVQSLRCDSGKYFNGTQGECLTDLYEVCYKSGKETYSNIEHHEFTESTTANSDQQTESINPDFQSTDSSRQERTFQDSSCIFDLNGSCVNSDSTIVDFDNESSTVDFKGYTDSNPSTESTTNDVPPTTESPPSDWQTTDLDLQFTTLKHNQYTESTNDYSDQQTESTDAESQSTDSALLELTSQDSCIFDLNGSCVGQSTSCTEGKKQRDINNCAGYLKCIDGKFVEEECPDRTYYDSISETCLVNSGQCVRSTSTCIEGIVEEDPKDCARYTQCIRGKIESLKCAFGKYFNVTQGECLIDVDEVCVRSRVEYDMDLEKLSYSESTISDSQESTSTDSTTSDLYTDSSIADFKGYTDWNPNTESTTNDVPLGTDSSTSDWQTTDLDLQFTTLDTTYNLENNSVTCVYNNKSLTEGIREVDPQDCAGYIECFGGEAKNLKCDFGKYFNITQRDCFIDVDEVCLKSNKTTVVDLHTTTESTPNFTTTIDPFAKCRDGQLRLDPNNCAGFLKCVDGELKEEMCPSGFFYDATTSKCIVDMRATCVTNIKFCIEGVREEDPNNCAGYRQCIRGSVQNLKCPIGQYFNVAERDCLYDVHKVCAMTEEDHSPVEVLHNDTGPPMTKPDESCILDINGVCVDPLAKCTEGQVKLDPNNCAGYLKCYNGELIVELCPDGFYYDLQLKMCLLDRRGICVTNIQICDEGALEEDPYNCAGYRQCIGGQVANLQCPFGSYFNVPLKDCLLDVDEICVRTEYKYFE